jgi:hypothetical protein
MMYGGTRRAGGRIWVRSAMAIAGAGAILATAFTAGPAWAKAANASSTVGAYYTLTPTHGVASASTTFVVPTATCTANLPEGQDLGIIDAWSNSGTDEMAVVTEICNGGTTPTYKFFVQADTVTFTENGVSPGDTVVASFYQTPGYNEARVHDLTSGYTWVADDNGAAATSVAIGAYGATYDGNLLLNTPFGTVPFTKTQINGEYLADSGAGAYNWTFGKSILVRTGKIAPSGDSFKLTSIGQ